MTQKLTKFEKSVCVVLSVLKKIIFAINSCICLTLNSFLKELNMGPWPKTWFSKYNNIIIINGDSPDKQNNF